jgi:hypothetical protein
MLKRTLNWFCVLLLSLGAAAAGTIWFSNYLLGDVSSDARGLAVSLTLKLVLAVGAVLLAIVGGIVIVFYRGYTHHYNGFTGAFFSLVCLIVAAVTGIIHASVTGEVRSSIMLFMLTPIVFGAVIAGSAAAFKFQMEGCTNPPVREEIRQSAICSFQWLGLSLFGALGLWLYFEAVIAHAWSPWWTLLLLVAYAGALRVLVPIAAQLLKWPIITEEQMSP